jgi:methyl-accepting chemotaxis protein
VVGGGFALAAPVHAALLEALGGGASLVPGVRAAIGVLALTLGGLLLAQLWASSLVAGAFAPFADEAPGRRLSRILELPGRVELAVLCTHAAAAAAALAVLAALGDLAAPAAVGGALAAAGASAAALFPLRARLDRQVAAAAAELAAPASHPPAGGFFRPRLASQLTVRMAHVALTVALLAALAGAAEHRPAAGRAVALVTIALVVLAGAAGVRRIGAAVAEGMGRIRDAVSSLTSGPVRAPSWLAADECGELAAATAVALLRTAELSWAVQHARDLVQDTLSLRSSAETLEGAARQLGASSVQQSEVLSAQAAALQETQITAQEIRQTSALAAQKAESVLKQAERADQLSQGGETAIEQSLSGLTDIREQVKDMSARIRELDERARQIANITVTVKDIADQSNMLALNAAIEAVRSGEHGKGFGVVAREIRTLADQSIKATNHVRDILQTIGEAIRSAVAMSERGAEKVERSLEQVRASGDTIRQLSTIVRDNAAAVRQISAAVNQQNAGIGQIFQAVSDLTKMMDRTMDQLRATESATEALRTEAGKVTDFVKVLRERQNGRAAEVSLAPPGPANQPPLHAGGGS